tara:strand:+ start:102 stop:635 length:534 start_codon:yes stop_codon:yes gene_type:complete
MTMPRPLLALLLLSACSMDEYIIEEGKHSSTSRVSLVSGTSMVFDAAFDASAIYETVDPSNQADINKLMGFSDCSSHHHSNSARFGWRWYDDELQIHAYTYADGTRSYALLGSVDIDSVEPYRIEIDADRYVFTFDGATTEMDRGCSGDSLAKYQLYPYFGGDETAPHDITILINEQ